MAKSKTKLRTSDQSNTKVALQAEIDACRASWATSLNGIRISAEALIECGKHLMEIKSIVNMTEFKALFRRRDQANEQAQLAFGYDTSERLMRIARQPLLEKHVDALPGAIETLYELSHLASYDADAFVRHVEAGDIHPHMRIKDARKLMGKRPERNARVVGESLASHNYGEQEGQQPKGKKGQLPEGSKMLDAATIIRIMKNIPIMAYGAPKKILRPVVAQGKVMVKELEAMLRAGEKSGPGRASKKPASTRAGARAGGPRPA